jgi:hypothetical protein
MSSSLFHFQHYSTFNIKSLQTKTSAQTHYLLSIVTIVDSHNSISVLAMSVTEEEDSGEEATEDATEQQQEDAPTTG